MNDHASRRIAVVIGAGGGLGAALVRQASQNGQVDGSSGAYRSVLPLGRHTQPPLDYTDEASLAAAARWVAAQCAESGAELRLLVVGSGFLHGEPGQPERSWAHLDAAYLNHVFAINTIGPALVMKHFLPLLPKCGRCVALHPGTVDTALSQPFAKAGLKVRPAEEAAGDLLRVLDRLTPSDSGCLVDYRGQRLPF